MVATFLSRVLRWRQVMKLHSNAAESEKVAATQMRFK